MRQGMASVRQRFRVLATTPRNQSKGSDAFEGAPASFALRGNYPNPFNPSTTISYDLPVDSRVVIKVYDMLGHEVATLVNAFQGAGHKSVFWDGRNSEGDRVSSGLFVYRMTAGDFSASQKMVLMK
jgi:hypothetical protein